MEVQVEPSPTAKRIRSYLSNNDELLYDKLDFLDHPLAGHCYVASEAYYHLSGGTDVWTPQQVNVRLNVIGRGESKTMEVSHWFLKNEQTGVIADLTSEQFGQRDVPYEKATGRGFLTSGPSKRAQQVIDGISQ